MKTITRRTALAGIASIPAIGGAGAATAEHPDADLIQLGKECEAAHARMMQASALADELGANRPSPESAPLLQRVSMPEEFQDLVYQGQTRESGITVAEFHLLEKVAPDHPLLVWSRERTERTLMEQEEFAARLHATSREYEAAEETFIKAQDELLEICERIFATPAHTLEGMAIKLQAGKWKEAGEYGEQDAAASVAADIKRMTGGAS